MEWLKRLGAAIDYIEENLDKEISYDCFLLGTL
mgnify:CR=1 FL=1